MTDGNIDIEFTMGNPSCAVVLIIDVMQRESTFNSLMQMTFYGEGKLVLLV